MHLMPLLGHFYFNFNCFSSISSIICCTNGSFMLWPLKKSYFNLSFTFLIFFSAISYNSADEIITLDTINKRLNQYSDTSRLEQLIKTAIDYCNLNADLSIEYSKSAIDLANKLGQSKKKIAAEIIIGRALFIKGEYTNAIEQLEKSIEDTRLINDSTNLIDIYRIYSLIYTRIGDFTKALEYSQKAFTLIGVLNQKGNLADIIRETGNIYYNFGEYKIALDFYQKSLAECQEKNDLIGMSKAYNNIGQIYIDLNQYSKALEFLNRSLEIKKKHDNKLSYTITLHNIGVIFFRQNDFKNAISYFSQSNKNYKEINYTAGISDSYQYLGLSYLKTKQYKLSEESFKKALEIASKARIKTLLLTIYLGLSDLYAETNHFDEAYQMLLKNKELKDSVFSEERRNLLMELDAKYNLRAKEKQISLLSKEQELKDTQQKKLAIWNILLAVMASFLIFIIYLIYSRMRFRGRVNRQLVDEIVQRKSAEEALHKYQEHLEAIVEDRTRDLKDAKDKAEESDMLKTAFLANMSHEIRTPMNAIVGFSNLLQEEDATAEEKLDYVKQINANSDVLMNLISDIIDISMIESGQIKLVKEEFYISDLLQNLLLQFDQEKNKLNKGNIAIVSEVEDKLMFLKINTDINRLKQVLSNLLSNAIKFTHEGTVTLGLKQGSNNRIVIYVKDTGIGIAPCNQSAIFERFNKFNSESDTMLYSGTGIGLTISKELVEMMGGNIWFESTINKGSIFYVSLPHSNTKISPNLNAKDDSKMEIESNFSDKTILVAEDVTSNFKLIKAYLKQSNVNLIWAKNGKEVIELLDKNIIHLILMDIQMPIMDGIQTTIEIRKKGIKTPIIIQTAYTLNNEIDKSFSAGCNDYITKPIRKDEFLTKISNYL